MNNVYAIIKLMIKPLEPTAMNYQLIDINSERIEAIDSSIQTYYSTNRAANLVIVITS